ncbi:alpha/beta-type small acid-soluble spore protein [Sporosarcina sp. Marseille-Q4943]|uniref:alpha/beta-type small acid-soluble spore protein n=1 Tax=Sporosarcina sp. Marseille-Q4943 TaxID=2942204 RepID=UPI00208DCADF|nr:alpha/beta-type small acid-soluble spore protein [Sporosarcina sp. Marseille-Q4943]
MGRKNRVLVPEARKQLDQLKVDVMKAKGYVVDDDQPHAVKFEIAKELGIPLSEEYNGKLTSEQAGKIGGPIGGNMVKEMVRLAQEQMARDKN